MSDYTRGIEVHFMSEANFCNFKFFFVLNLVVYVTKSILLRDKCLSVCLSVCPHAFREICRSLGTRLSMKNYENCEMLTPSHKRWQNVSTNQMAGFYHCIRRDLIINKPASLACAARLRTLRVRMSHPSGVSFALILKFHNYARKYRYYN